MSMPTIELKDTLFKRKASVSGNDLYADKQCKGLTIIDPLTDEEAKTIFNSSINDRYNRLINADYQDADEIMTGRYEDKVPPIVQNNPPEAVSSSEVFELLNANDILFSDKKVAIDNSSVAVGAPMISRAQIIEPLPTRERSKIETPVESKKDIYESKNNDSVTAEAVNAKKEGSLLRWGIVAIVVFALVLIATVTFIAINTSVINSLNADISSLQMEAEVLTTQLEALQAQISESTAFETIKNWAESVGMYFAG